MRNVFRLFLAFSIFFLFNNFAFSDSYKITDVSYNIKGQTRESVLKTKVKIDTTTVFENEEDFLSYIRKLKQDFENTRNFESVDITYTISNSNDEYSDVSLVIQTVDSFHFLPVPYPKYTTSGGFSLKIKIKDTNFLGSMNTLDSSIDFAIKTDGKIEPGVTFKYNYPFKQKENTKYQITWLNDLSFGITFPQAQPTWNLNTGIEWSLPNKNATLKLQFMQGFVRNLDYLAYGDDIYLSENLRVSYPLSIAQFKNGTIIFNPYLNFNYKFDPFRANGYSGFKHNDLKGPVITTGITFDFSNVNWNRNFRNGFSFSVGPVMSYNFASITQNTYDFYFGLNAFANAYKSFEHIAFNARMWAFSYINNVGRLSGSNNVDGYLRGIVDGSDSAHNTSADQSNTPTALVFNFDMPLRVGTVDWTKIPGFKKIKFMKYLNFELQVSPFIDIALIQTIPSIHGYYRLFDLRDGFYTAGLEVIVFPQRWKGIEVRASIGWDIGLLVYGPMLETSWRNKAPLNSNILKAAEIFIGIGLHY